jgi:hypothetical protein
VSERYQQQERAPGCVGCLFLLLLVGGGAIVGGVISNALAPSERANCIGCGLGYVFAGVALGLASGLVALLLLMRRWWGWRMFGW